MTHVVIDEPAEVLGDAVTVTGTVDGVSVTVTVWKSHLDTLPDKAAMVQYCAERLKEAATLPTEMDVKGTVTV